RSGTTRTASSAGDARGRPRRAADSTSAGAVTVMSRSLELLRQLVAIPSVNPMGRDAPGPEFREGRLSDFLESFFRRLGVACARTEVAPGRANVVARFDAAGATRTVLLDAHQDTVSVDGMTVAPFTPAERDGRLYGRGA